MLERSTPARAPRAILIALDGPAAAGKGTLGRALAAAYDLAYLDTGKLYRALAAKAHAAGAPPEDDAALEAIAGALTPEDLSDPGLSASAISAIVSAYAARPAARAALLETQRRFAREAKALGRGAVLDGRDIGTVVLPDADVKLFVTADLETRARRRLVDLLAAGESASVEAVAAALAARDRQDSERAAAPLRPAADALLLDTSALSIEDALAAARRLIDAALPPR